MPANDLPDDHPVSREAEAACRFFNDPLAAATAEPDFIGVPVGVLTDWPDGALDKLRAAARRTARDAPALGAWLDDIAIDEQTRRMKNARGKDGDHPREAGTLYFPAFHWLNSEVGPALVLGAVCREAFADDPYLGPLFAEVERFLNALAASRLAPLPRKP